MLAAIAIQNARLYASLEHLAITDGLTGLYNHRYFYDRLAQEVARAQRYELPLSLLMIDIDDFKAYNDRYGHRAGDALLRGVGALLQARRRDSRSTWWRATAARSSPSSCRAPRATAPARAGERLRDASPRA